MKILLSAFACSPEWGSEPGVGWRWAELLARSNDVTVVTHRYFEDHIKRRDSCPARLRVVYVEPPWPSRWNDELLNSIPYYVLWQAAAYRTVRMLLRGERFDVIHHITWGTFRYPSFLGLLGVPFVFGPVGGGERAPVRLRRSLRWADRVRESVRDLILFSGRFDPLVNLSVRSASVVFVKTQETAAVLPWGVASRVVLSPEIGAPDSVRDVRRPGAGRDDFRLLMVGRLIGLKGVHLAMAALARLRSDEPVSMDIVGKGAAEAWLRVLAQRLGVAARVRFHPHVPRDVVLDMYADADCLMFPSLHDSSGNVVLEALSRGLPVICLDLGGPKYFVDASCGIVVSTSGRTESEVVGGLLDAIGHLKDTPGLRARLSAGAFEAAQRLTWDRAVSDAYRVVQDRLRIS